MKLYMQLEKRSKCTAGSASSPLLPLKVDIVVVTAPDERTGIERGQRFFASDGKTARESDVSFESKNFRVRTHYSIDAICIDLLFCTDRTLPKVMPMRNIAISVTAITLCARSAPTGVLRQSKKTRIQPS
jgi:hypothetical protein